MNVAVCLVLLLSLSRCAGFRNRGSIPDSPLVMYWTFLSNKELRVEIEWNHKSFAPIILARNMVGTDLWLCSKESVTQEYEITDRWAYDHAPPILDVDGSHDGIGTDDFRDKTVFETEFGMTCSFTRLLNTGDHKDKILVRGETYQLCSFRSSSPNLQMHHEDLSDIFCWYWDLIDHFDGEFRQAPRSRALAVLHGVVMTVLWGVLIDVSLLIIRYLKTMSNTVRVHAAMMLVINTATLAMALMMIVTRSSIVFYNFSTLSIAAKIHFLMGLTLLTSLILQHVGGAIVKHLKQSTHLEAQRFLKKIWIHRVGGYLVYGVSKLQLLLGWWVIEGGFSTIFAVLLAWYLFLLVCRIFAEYSYRRGKWLFSRLMTKLSAKSDQRSAYPHTTKVSLTEKDELLSVSQERTESLVYLVRNHQSRQHIRQNYPNYRYVFFKNMLCDLSDFNHPGGASLIESVIGEEISKYLYGAAIVEDNPTQIHIHSKYAISHLESRCISKLEDPVCDIFQQQWQLQHTTQLSPNLFKLTFFNRSFTIRTNPRIPSSYLGKYFLITVGGVVRPYTLLLSQLEYNIIFRNKLIEFYKRKFVGPFELSKQPVSHEISFIIKRYPEGEVSRSVHFGVASIEGLYGLGLQLEAGTNIVVTGGTGILPFLDLFDLLLKKAIFAAALGACAPSEAPTDSMNIFSLNYSEMLPNVKIRLYASFNCSDEFRNYSWLLDLHLLSKKLGIGLFELNLRIPKQSEQLEPGSTFFSHVNQEFCDKNFPIGSFSKVYCCGPPQMNRLILKVFKQLRYPRSLYRIM